MGLADVSVVDESDPESSWYMLQNGSTATYVCKNADGVTRHNDPRLPAQPLPPLHHHLGTLAHRGGRSRCATATWHSAATRPLGIPRAHSPVLIPAVCRLYIGCVSALYRVCVGCVSALDAYTHASVHLCVRACTHAYVCLCTCVRISLDTHTPDKSYRLYISSIAALYVGRMSDLYRMVTTLYTGI